MIKYDKIYIPAQQNDVGEYDQFVSQTPVIVLTRDEAFDLWMAAMDYCDHAHGKKDFAAYLQSKGITL